VAKHWTGGEFPQLDLPFFQNHCAGGDPRLALREWRAFLPRARSDDAKYRKALELTSGLTPGAVYHYLFGRREPASGGKTRKLAANTIRALDAVSTALGCEPGQPPPLSLPSKRGVRRIVLFGDLAGSPSPRYHLTVLESIVRAGDRLNFSVAVHQVSQADTDLAAHTARILRNNPPHAVVWFRLTPDEACLEAMAAYTHQVPVVLVHAGRRVYPFPVIANVVPNQQTIPEGVMMWARALPGYTSKSRKRREVIIAAMDPDKPTPAFKPVPGRPVSIREERITHIATGIRAAGLRPITHTVGDYSASQAAEIVHTYPDAIGYVCLSDEIAVGVKQLLHALGHDPKSRILGFDGSALARRHHIPSFDQRLGDIGEAVIEQFSRWFDHGGIGEPREYHEVPVDLKLSL
jgi:DNA-binding LacI/PurR family transcriptional regulator